MLYCLFAVGAEDAAAVGNQENLVLESDFLLEQELGFGENDYRIVGFERDSGQRHICITLIQLKLFFYIIP